MKDRSRAVFVLVLVSIGLIAYMCASVVHEVVGHGLACIALGGKVVLLTAVYYKGLPTMQATFLCGPLGNLLLGIFSYWVLKKQTSTTFYSLLWYHIMLFNFFWFSGTMLYCAVTDTGDWSLPIMYQYHIAGAWRIVTGTIGLVLYMVFFRIGIRQFSEKFGGDVPVRMFVLVPYWAALLGATVAGALFSPTNLASAKEGFFSALAFFPLFFIPINIQKTFLRPKAAITFFKRPVLFIALAFILYVAFCLTLGKGLQF